VSSDQVGVVDLRHLDCGDDNPVYYDVREVIMDQPSTAFRALAHAIKNEPPEVRDLLRTLGVDDLRDLINGLDVLGALADEEITRRMERRS